MDPLLSKYQCELRRGFSAQDCLLVMLKKWEPSVDKGKAFGVLLTDLSKVYHCFLYELIVAKLNAYGFSLSVLKLMQSYASERKQKTKINQAYSSWGEIPFGVPQGSALGSILFNIFLIDLFLDDNTIYHAGDVIDKVILFLKEYSKKLFKWFPDKQMKTNEDKYHLIVSTNEFTEIQVGNLVIL